MSQTTTYETDEHGMPTVETQWNQACRWRGLLEGAGYFAELHGTSEDEPFNREWQIFGPGWNGPRVATIDIDGCGASWHGPDELWTSIIGPSEGVAN
jgi:hypothetical protein